MAIFESRTLHGCVDWNNVTHVLYTLVKLSHPTRVRGLKLCLVCTVSYQILSHPTRVRGLKYLSRQVSYTMWNVAPYTGAWIEIVRLARASIRSPVAPYTGAWIEISICENFSIPFVVAPYTGAWIEIQIIKGIYLNLNRRTLHGCVDWNEPISETNLNGVVAPYTGAWIEISYEELKTSDTVRRTLHGCVDWN